MAQFFGGGARQQVRRLASRALTGLVAIALGAGSLVGVVWSVGPAGAEPSPGTSATVTVGSYPSAVVISPSGSTAYVAVPGSTPQTKNGTVSVINTAATPPALTKTITVQKDPAALAVGGTTLWVVNQLSDSISIVNTTTEAVTSTVSLPVAEPNAIVLSPTGDYAYVAGSLSDVVTVLATTATPPSVIDTVPLGTSTFPAGIAVNAGGTRIYVTNDDTGADTVSVLDATVPSAPTLGAPVTVGLSPVGITLTPTRHYAYVANYGGTSVSVLNVVGPTPVLTATIHIPIPGVRSSDPPHPTITAFAPNGQTAYVGLSTAGYLAVIDTASTPPALVGYRSGATNSEGVAVTPDGDWVYASEYQLGKVSVLPTTAPPEVTAISPSSGTSAGDTTLTLTGTGFTGATAVVFGGSTDGSNLSVNSQGTQLTVTTPPGSGTEGVAVTAPTGQSAPVYYRYMTPLSITTTSAPGADVGVPYSTIVAATGGTSPYHWSVTDGSLPGSLSLNPTTGAITGTPTTTGTSTFTVTVTDSATPTAATATEAFSITVGTGPTISTSSLPGGAVGSSYSATLAKSGGVPPYTWTVSAGSLPAGLSLAGSTGTLSGKPTAPGSSSFTVKVTDGAGLSATKALSITVLGISTTSLPSGLVSHAYSAALAATGGTGSYTWSLKSGSTLPTGLSLSSSGAITGTPTTTGSKSVTFKVASGSFTATKALTITINPALSVTTSSLTEGVVGTAYSATLAATGGTTPYTWSVSTGALPGGLSLSASTGAITGTPSAAGTFTFTAKVTDATTPTPGTATKVLTITVASSTLTITSGSTLPPATKSQAYSTTLAASGGTTPYTWSKSGTLPTGLTLGSTGKITGTPSATGTKTVTVTVTDKDGLTASKSVSITVGTTSVAPAFTSANATTFVEGTTWSFTITSSGSPTATVSEIGTLPAWLTFTPESAGRAKVVGYPPAGSAGTYTFTLVATNGVSPNAVQLFTLTVPTPPAVIGISPASGPLAGGTIVTVSGSGFSGATAVSFGSAAASSFTVDSATEITATAPAAAGVGVDVTVTTSAGTSATGPADKFSYEQDLVGGSWPLLVANGTGSTVSDITPTGTITIPVGLYPDSVAVTPDGQYALVTSNGNDSISVIGGLDTGSPAVVDTIDTSALGSAPQSVAVSPTGTYAAVAFFASNSVGIVTGLETGDPTLGTSPITAGTGPVAVAISPDGSAIYIPDIYTGKVTVVRNPTGLASVQTLDVGGVPNAVAFTPNGQTALVTNGGANAVDVIDDAESPDPQIGTPIALPTGSQPQGVTVIPDGQYAYVADSGTESVSTIAGPGSGSPTLSATVLGVGDLPLALVTAPSGNTVYVMNGQSTSASVITGADTASPSVTATLRTDLRPYSAAVVPDQAPVAALSVTPGLVGHPTAFDASASTVGFGTIIAYAWTFGDGHSATTTTPTTAHTYTTAGTYLVRVTETDSAGTSTTQVFTGQTVSRHGGSSAVATAMVTAVTPTTAFTITAGGQAASVVVAPGSPVTLADAGLPPAAGGYVTFTTGGTSLCTATLPATTCTPAALPVGTYPVTASFADTDGTYLGSPATNTVTLTVARVTVTAPASQQTMTQAAVSLAVAASVSPAGTLVYSATNLPAGLSINPATGLISGITGGATSRSYVTVTVGDGGVSATTGFLWTVARPLSGTPVPTQYSWIHSTATLPVHFTDSAPTAVLSYTATNLPAGLSISPTTGAITGTTGTGTGRSFVTVTATDGTRTATTSFLWYITNPLSATTPATQESWFATTVNLPIAVTDGVPGAVLSYSATNLPGGLSINHTTGVITGTTAATTSRSLVIVVATDGTFSVSVSFLWYVTNPLSAVAPPAQSTWIDTAVTLPVTFTDAFGLLIYSATNLPTGLSINPLTGVISGTTTGVGGRNYVTVTAHSGPYATSVSFTWTVSNPLSATAPAAQSSWVHSAVTLPVIITDASGGTLAYAATNLPTGLSINAATGVVRGTTPSITTRRFVTVTATDGTYSTSVSFLWTVTNPMGSVTPHTQYSFVDTTISPLPVSFTDAVPGSTLTYSAANLPPGLSVNPATGVIGGTTGGATTKRFVTVTATDGTFSASVSFLWYVTRV